MVRYRNKDATCRIDDCEKPAFCIGMCSTHWSRYRRHGDPNKVLSEEEKEVNRRAGMEKKRARRQVQGLPEAKKCTRCEVVKAASEFYRVKYPSGAEGLYSKCKVCHNEITTAAYIKARDKAREERAAAKAAAIKNDGICVVEGCKNKQHNFKHGFCRFHYGRFKNGRALTGDRREHKRSKIEGNDSIRVCTTCDEVKNVSQFYKRPSGNYQAQCKACMSVLNGLRQYLYHHDNVAGAREMIREYTDTLRIRAERVIDNYVERTRS